MSQNNDNSFMEKVKHLLSEVNIQTYLYALLAIGAIVLIVSNTKLENKNYLVNTNSDTECRDPHGKIIKIDPSKGEGCVDIFGAAKDYGIDLSYIDNNNSSTNTNNSDNNITLDMSKDLILANMYLDQNNITDPTEKGKILANVVSSYQDNSQSKIYTVSDLNINRNEDKSSLQNYYNQIAGVLNNYSISIKQIQNSNDTKSNSLTTLDQNTINLLLVINATTGGASYQLELINLLNKQITYIESLNQIGNDPAKFIILGGSDYSLNFNNQLNNIITELTNYFSIYNINKVN